MSNLSVSFFGVNSNVPVNKKKQVAFGSSKPITSEVKFNGLDALAALNVAYIRGTGAKDKAKATQEELKKEKQIFREQLIANKEQYKLSEDNVELLLKLGKDKATCEELLQHWSKTAGEFPWKEVSETKILEMLMNDPSRFVRFLDRLKRKNNLSPESVIQMARMLSDKNYSANIKKEINNPNLDSAVNIITNVDNMRTENIADLLISGMSVDEHNRAIKQLAKTLKLALKTPNQYLSDIPLEYTKKVNGKYPNLSKELELLYQRRITLFFQKNYATLLRASNYLDADTINQMMDKRTSLFQESLENLDNLTNENYQILSNLTKCSSMDRDNKALTAREKVQLCQIVEIFQKCNFDSTTLKTMVEAGEVSLRQLKEYIQKEVLKKAGISETDLAKIPPEKQRFNPEYSYLVLCNNADQILDETTNTLLNTMHFKEVRAMPKKEREKMIKEMQESFETLSKTNLVLLPKSQLKGIRQLIDIYKNIDQYTDEEIEKKLSLMIKNAISGITNQDEIYTVIKESTLGDFTTFINDTSNKYGATNAQTANAFEQNGINYQQWLKPDIPDVNFDLNGERMTIKMMDRNPQEDLFLGNKTSCCTAIGTGFNAAAMPIYLLNTSFNIVELYNEAGEVVGMSRIFMSNVDNKPSVIMDNFELNTNYKDSKISDEAKIQIRDKFFEYMNNFSTHITGDNDSQVYFSAMDIHVPTSDLSKKNITLDFIGNVAQEQVYINSVGCIWQNPKQLGNLKNLNYLVVPRK